MNNDQNILFHCNLNNTFLNENDVEIILTLKTVISIIEPDNNDLIDSSTIKQLTCSRDRYRVRNS